MLNPPGQPHRQHRVKLGKKKLVNISKFLYKYWSNKRFFLGGHFPSQAYGKIKT
jgi:hypothetical protein